MASSRKQISYRQCCFRMYWLNILVVIILLLKFVNPSVGTAFNKDKHSKYKKEKDEGFFHAVFPTNFKWGVGTSAFQVEGAFDADGKGESIWDKFTKDDPDKIEDGSNATISSDAYNHYKSDVLLIKSLGAKMYRFSISWSRVLPKGTTEVINKLGLDYYNNLINELISHGIEPVVCLFHWDLPQNLQEQGGWLNQETVGIFGDYARLIYGQFGDRVKHFITINDPWTFCIYGYDKGIFAPGNTDDPAVNPYSCVHSLILGHTMAYRIYKEEFASQKGKVGISLDNFWQEPSDPNSSEDKAAAEQSYSFRFDWIAYPLLKGEYPPIMRKIIDKKSQKEKLKESRLPKFNSEWTAKVNGSLDFIGINHFTTQLVKFSQNATNASNWEADSGTIRYYDPKWPATGSKWLKVVPEGIRKSLNKIRKDYGSNIEIIITENGVSDSNVGSAQKNASLLLQAELNDTQRIEYHRLYINEVLKAVQIDGCNVTGYFVWNLLDGFEWDSGYKAKFGIIHVDHQHPNRTRTPKQSMKALQKIFKDNGFPAKKFEMNAVPVFESNFKISPSNAVIASAPFAIMLSAYYAYVRV